MSGWQNEREPGKFPKPKELLSGPGTWHGAELRQRDDWIHHWSAREIRELETAVARVRAGGRPLVQIGRGDFTLPHLGPWMTDLRNTLLRSRGFVLLRGLDPRRYCREDIATLFWGLGTHLGEAVPQNAQGHMLGHVTDLGRDAADPRVRIYQTRERQGYHTDSADVVGLLCLCPAKDGGRSSLVSAATLHNTLFRRCPELLDELFRPFCTDHRGEHPPGTPPYFTAPVFSWHDGHLSVQYQRAYIESAQRFAQVPRLTDAQIQALDALDRACEDPSIHLQMDLEPGDIQFIHNHQLLHDRTAFRDHSDPAQKRHLLRLWLCPPDGRPLPPWFAERLRSVEPGRRGGVALDGVEPVTPLVP